jgi:hypothetical protein
VVVPVSHPRSRWGLGDGATVYEQHSDYNAPRLYCLADECAGKPWCKHRQKVVIDVMDAPLLSNVMESRVIDLEVQPTQGFYVPTTLTNIGPGTFSDGANFHAVCRGEPTPGSTYSLDLGDFFASDGRLGIREMFLVYLKTHDRVSCTSTAHHVLASRQPKDLADRWAMMTRGACLACVEYLDTSHDVPDIKFSKSPYVYTSPF